MRLKDFIGQRFYFLEIIKLANMKNGVYSFLCKCACGNTSVCKYNNLREGKTKSCGCGISKNVVKKSAYTDEIIKRSIAREGSCYIWLGPRDKQGDAFIYNLSMKKIYILEYLYRKQVLPIKGYCAFKSNCGNNRCIKPDHHYVTFSEPKESI